MTANLQPLLLAKVGGVLDVAGRHLPDGEQLGRVLDAAAGGVPAHGPQAVDIGRHGVPQRLEHAVDLEHGRGAVECEAVHDQVAGRGVGDAVVDVEAHGPGGRRHVEDRVLPERGLVAGRQRVGDPLGRGAAVLFCEGETLSDSVLHSRWIIPPVHHDRKTYRRQRSRWFCRPWQGRRCMPRLDKRWSVSYSSQYE